MGSQEITWRWNCSHWAVWSQTCCCQIYFLYLKVLVFFNFSINFLSVLLFSRGYPNFLSFHFVQLRHFWERRTKNWVILIILMGFDPTLHSHINFLLEFAIFHDFSHRAARDFHPKLAQNISFETAVHNINSHLCCRGGAAWPLPLSTRMNTSHRCVRFSCSLRHVEKFGGVPQGGGVSSLALLYYWWGSQQSLCPPLMGDRSKVPSIAPSYNI